jgi:hypothetical protein
MPIQIPEPSVTVTTDASNEGWGGHSGDNNCLGYWTKQEAGELHINCLEMKAVTLTLQEVNPPPGSSILCRTDNTATMWHIKKQGGTRSWPMMRQTWDLMSLAERNRWFLASQHVAGKDNYLADKLSRSKTVDDGEWMLNPGVLTPVFHSWG